MIQVKPPPELIKIIAPPLGVRHTRIVSRRLFHVYLVTSAVFLLLGGSMLGVMMLLQLAGFMPVRAWPAHVAAHASFQVYGFMVMLILGVAYRMLRIPSFPVPLMTVSYLSLLAGTVTGAFQLSGWSEVLLTLGALPVLLLAWPYGAFLRTGALWLIVAPWTGKPDVALWGFACLFALGMGQRMHPALLGQPAPPRWIRRAVWMLWNLGLILAAPGLLLLAACLQVRGLRVFGLGHKPTARPWLATSLKASYAWLLLACVLAVVGAPVSLTRHALATGYLMTLLLAMAWYLLPALDRRPRFPGPVTLLGGWQMATVLRLTAQSLGWATTTALGGILQLVTLAYGSWQLWRRLRAN